MTSGRRAAVRRSYQASCLRLGPSDKVASVSRLEIHPLMLVFLDLNERRLQR
jgi:hypothetical protein